MLFDVWLVSRAATGVLDAALAPTGLSADEFGIYSVLTTAAWVTPSELARWMSAPLTTVSSHVKRLEARGHVTRTRHPEDGRSHLLALTPEGHRVHRAAAERFLPVLAGVVESLGPREVEVREALAALRRSLDATARADGGSAEVDAIRGRKQQRTGSKLQADVILEHRDTDRA